MIPNLLQSLCLYQKPVHSLSMVQDPHHHSRLTPIIPVHLPVQRIREKSPQTFLFMRSTDKTWHRTLTHDQRRLQPLILSLCPNISPSSSLNPCYPQSILQPSTRVQCRPHPGARSNVGFSLRPESKDGSSP